MSHTEFSNPYDILTESEREEFNAWIDSCNEGTPDPQPEDFKPCEDWQTILESQRIRMATNGQIDDRWLFDNPTESEPNEGADDFPIDENQRLDDNQRRNNVLAEIKGLVLDASNMAQNLADEFNDLWADQIEVDSDGKRWQICDTPEHQGAHQMAEVHETLNKLYHELSDMTNTKNPKDGR